MYPFDYITDHPAVSASIATIGAAAFLYTKKYFSTTSWDPLVEPSNAYAEEEKREITKVAVVDHAEKLTREQQDAYLDLLIPIFRKYISGSNREAAYHYLFPTGSNVTRIKMIFFGNNQRETVGFNALIYEDRKGENKTFATIRSISYVTPEYKGGSPTLYYHAQAFLFHSFWSLIGGKSPVFTDVMTPFSYMLTGKIVNSFYPQHDKEIPNEIRVLMEEIIGEQVEEKILEQPYKDRFFVVKTPYSFFVPEKERSRLLESRDQNVNLNFYDTQVGLPKDSTGIMKEALFVVIPGDPINVASMAYKAIETIIKRKMAPETSSEKAAPRCT